MLDVDRGSVHDDPRDVPNAIKRMTMASSPEGCWPPWEAERVKRRVKEKCTRCEEWKRKFREQNVSYFRESGHHQHAIKRLLNRCSEYMTESQYRQLEQSLQLDVRFFSEHSVVDADFTDDSPRFQGDEGAAVAQLQEKIATLEQENEALQTHNDELEASLRQAQGMAISTRRTAPPKEKERPATARKSVHCQTGEAGAGEAFSFQPDPTEWVKKELDKVTQNRDNLALALQAAQQDARATVAERNSLEQRVRDLQTQLEKKFSAAVPGVHVPPAHVAHGHQSPSRSRDASHESARLFMEQVAESDLRVQETLSVDQATSPVAAHADQATSPCARRRLTVEDGTPSPKAISEGTSFAEASTRLSLFQERSIEVQTDPPDSADFGMQVDDWDIAGDASITLRGAGAPDQRELTRKTKSFKKERREEPKFSLMGGGPPVVLAGGDTQPSGSPDSSAQSTAASQFHAQSGGHRANGAQAQKLLPNLTKGDPRRQATQQGAGKRPAASSSAGFLPAVPSASSSMASSAAAFAAQVSGSRSAAELTPRSRSAGEVTHTPPRGPPVGPAAAAPTFGSSPAVGPEAAWPEGPGKKKRSRAREKEKEKASQKEPEKEKASQKEPEPYLYEVWEKYPDSHKKPSDTELMKLGACKPPPAESEGASGDQA